MCINSINVISNVLPPPCLSRSSVNGVLKNLPHEKTHQVWFQKSLIYLTPLLASACRISLLYLIDLMLI